MTKNEPLKSSTPWGNRLKQLISTKASSPSLLQNSNSVPFSLSLFGDTTSTCNDTNLSVTEQVYHCTNYIFYWPSATASKLTVYPSQSGCFTIPFSTRDGSWFFCHLIHFPACSSFTSHSFSPTSLNFLRLTHFSYSTTGKEPPFLLRIRFRNCKNFDKYQKSRKNPVSSTTESWKFILGFVAWTAMGSSWLF